MTEIMNHQWTITRTDSSNKDFQHLVHQLDQYLAVRNGDDNAFFAQFNKIDRIRHVVLAYRDEQPVGCGAMKEYDPHTMEIKRMFVPAALRGKGIARLVLAGLESWARELGYKRCILETGNDMRDAVGLYTKSGYSTIPNYGQYAGVDSSVCFEKVL
jgi:putative acetyltransferase